jgi:hypothetical protein
MCVISAVGGEFGRTFPDRYPTIQPGIHTTPYIPPTPTPVTRAEFEALRLEMQELRKVLLAAKAFDEATGQPDCEMEEKVTLIKRLAELVGVSMDDIFPEE